MKLLWIGIVLLVVKYSTDKASLLKLIKGTAHNYNLNWCVVAGVAWAESNYDPAAIGDDGKSIGLMQIQIATASWIVGRDVSRDELLVPAFNVDLGCRYLKYQLERYEGDYNKAIAAYNAGSYRERSPGVPINQNYVLRVRNGADAIGSISDCR